LCPNHFLDTSILLGTRIKWDPQITHVSKYMGVADIRRISSKRAYDEAKGVLHRNRRAVTQYIDGLNREFSRPGNPVINADGIHRFSNYYIARLRENEKVKNALSRFSNTHVYEITSVLQGGNTSIDQYKQKIRMEFQAGLDSLDLDCVAHDGACIRRYDICPPVYDTVFSTELAQLMQVMNYLSDVNVLLDTHYIQQQGIVECGVFVTTDHQHFLSKKAGIEQILTAISITHPQEHYPAN